MRALPVGGRSVAAILILFSAILLWPDRNAEATDPRFRRFGHRSGMILIPAGTFVMGSNGRGMDEAPERRVWLDAYLIDRFEVTQREYDRCVEAGVCAANQRFPNEGGPQQPVVGVSWKDAATYCAFVDKRLPTEAEWEKAARGEDGRLYPWGDTVACGYGNFGRGHNDECPGAPGHSAEVGSYARDVSPWGVHDMAGNAWEHVSDFYDRDWPRTAPRRNPTGPTKAQGPHVLKGGSWYTTLDMIALSGRISRPETRTPYDGFRCARAGPPAP